MASKWIRFELAGETAKTKVWAVVASDGDVVLGRVKWFGRWRGYAFFPEADRVFERTCLRDIAAFIDEQMAARREAKASAPASA